MCYGEICCIVFGGRGTVLLAAEAILLFVRWVDEFYHVFACRGAMVWCAVCNFYPVAGFESFWVHVSSVILGGWGRARGSLSRKQEIAEGLRCGAGRSRAYQEIQGVVRHQVLHENVAGPPGLGGGRGQGHGERKSEAGFKHDGDFVKKVK